MYWVETVDGAFSARLFLIRIYGCWYCRGCPRKINTPSKKLCEG